MFVGTGDQYSEEGRSQSHTILIIKHTIIILSEKSQFSCQFMYIN